jgi:predicted RNase H-like HicB family nuclease
MFNELGDDEQEGLCQRARDDAKEAWEVYTKAMKSPPSKAPEDRQR